MKSQETIFLSPREAARRCGVSVSTLYKWEATGKIPAIKTLGGQNRFQVEVVEELLKNQTVKSKGSNHNE